MQRSAEVEQAARRFYSALSSGDMAVIDSLISQDEAALFVGTDGKEWWDSRADLIRALEAQTKEMQGFEFVPSKVESFEHGDVGWFADQSTIKAPDGTEIPARITATLIREGGDWKIVHGHASVGADNEEVVGKELTV